MNREGKPQDTRTTQETSTPPRRQHPSTRNWQLSWKISTSTRQAASATRTPQLSPGDDLLPLYHRRLPSRGHHHHQPHRNPSAGELSHRRPGHTLPREHHHHSPSPRNSGGHSHVPRLDSHSRRLTGDSLPSPWMNLSSPPGLISTAPLHHTGASSDSLATRAIVQGPGGPFYHRHLFHLPRLSRR